MTRGTALTTGHLRVYSLLLIVDKVFAKLLSERIASALCLHDQQYAFHPGSSSHYTTCWQLCGNTPSLTKPRTRVLDAAKAFDTVPHTLRLHRLLQCGVTGPAFAVSSDMYSSASSRVRVGSALSPALRLNVGLRKGAAQSPLLYAVFVDLVQQDMQALTHPDVLWVGPAVL